MGQTWMDFATATPDLAAFGVERIHGRVVYLATVRADGTARVHPVTPIVGGGRLFIFMEPTSPKGHDLRRGSGYALHSTVQDNSGAGGEFTLRGRGALIEDGAVRATAIQAATYAPADRYILFELSVDGASSTVYEGGRPVRRRWGAP